MKRGIVFGLKKFEKSWNGLRFAVTSKRLGREVKVFQMREAVENDGRQ